MLWCECYRLKVVGHMDCAGEVLCCFGAVGDAPCGEVPVFGVVEQQMFHSQLLCQAAGIQCRAVVFLVGVEKLSVAIQAECFAHEPVAAAHIALARGLEWLIAQAHKALSVGQDGAEAILLCLGRGDVEKREWHRGNVDVLAVVHLLQNDSVANGACNLVGHHEPAHGVDGLNNQVVAVDGERAVEFSLVHHG